MLGVSLSPRQVNIMFNLPTALQAMIYSFDVTYREKFDQVLVELQEKRARAWVEHAMVFLGYEEGEVRIVRKVDSWHLYGTTFQTSIGMVTFLDSSVSWWNNELSWLFRTPKPTEIWTFHNGITVGVHSGW